MSATATATATVTATAPPATATAAAANPPAPPPSPSPRPPALQPPPPPAQQPPGSAPGLYTVLTEIKGLVEIPATAQRKAVRLPVVATIPQQQQPPAAGAAAEAGAGAAAAGPPPPPPWPVLVLLGGFQSRASMYRPLARRIASHGYAVLQYTSPLLKIIPDSQELPFLAKACGWLKRRAEEEVGGKGADKQEDAALGAPVPALGALNWSRAAVMGHSRGGKLAALHYARGFFEGDGDGNGGAGGGNSGGSGSGGGGPADPPSFLPRFRACFLIDPVDNTSITPEGPLYPSAVRALRDLGAAAAAAAAAAGAATASAAADAPAAAPAPPPPLVPPSTCAPPSLACATPAAAAAAMSMAASLSAGAAARPPPPPPPPPPLTPQPQPQPQPQTPRIGLVGAGIIGPSNPEGSNWRLFADAARDALPGSRVAVLEDAGHTAFMSAVPGGFVGAALLDALFGGGGERNGVLDRTAAAALAWLGAELGGEGGVAAPGESPGE